jgi:hypothetical protein
VKPLLDLKSVFTRKRKTIIVVMMMMQFVSYSAYVFSYFSTSMVRFFSIFALKKLLPYVYPGGIRCDDS